MNKAIKIALYAIAAPPALIGAAMSAGVLVAFLSIVFSAVGSVFSGLGSAMYWVAEYLLMIPALTIIADTMQVLGLAFFLWVIAAVVALIVLHLAQRNKTARG